MDQRTDHGAEEDTEGTACLEPHINLEKGVVPIHSLSVRARHISLKAAGSNLRGKLPIGLGLSACPPHLLGKRRVGNSVVVQLWTESPAYQKQCCQERCCDQRKGGAGGGIKRRLQLRLASRDVGDSDRPHRRAAPAGYDNVPPLRDARQVWESACQAACNLSPYPTIIGVTRGDHAAVRVSIEEDVCEVTTALASEC